MATHLAILREPYLSRILMGVKTIESRFLRVRTAPYGCVAAGDRLLLKRSGGPITATARVTDVAFYDNLTPTRVAALIDQYAGGLCLDDDMLKRAQRSRYAVLIWLGDVAPIEFPPLLNKRDRRAWVVLKS
ncbi:MAG: ASCH domain-containing protein [Roseiflexus sp.]